MNWKDYIETDQEVLSGKPVIKGTRISVEFILDLLAQGWTTSDVLENYTNISSDALHAVFAFTAEVMHEEHFYYIKKGAA